MKLRTLAATIAVAGTLGMGLSPGLAVAQTPTPVAPNPSASAAAKPPVAPPPCDPGQTAHVVALTVEPAKDTHLQYHTLPGVKYAHSKPKQLDWDVAGGGELKRVDALDAGGWHRDLPAPLGIHYVGQQEMTFAQFCVAPSKTWKDHLAGAGLVALVIAIVVGFGLTGVRAARRRN